MSDISKFSDYGTPLPFVLPEQHTLNQIYSGISAGIQKEILKPKNKVNVYYNTAERAVIIEEEKTKRKIDPYTLRASCKCAGCID